MTYKEAIQWYETKLAVNESLGLHGPQNEAAKLALAALREHEERADNPVITREELWGMDKKPVFVVPQGEYADREPEWCVIGICGEYSRAEPAAAENYWFEFKDYGTKWLAYRHEPEEEKT